MFDRPTRLEVLAALRAEGVDPGADLAAIEAAARRLGFDLELASHDGKDLRGRASVLHRASVGRGGWPVGVAYSSESRQAAAIEALGRALIRAHRQAGGQVGQLEGVGNARCGSPSD